MNYLKNAAGLLNAQAPEGEFLAYINPGEAKMLKDAGGLQRVSTLIHVVLIFISIGIGHHLNILATE